MDLQLSENVLIICERGREKDYFFWKRRRRSYTEEFPRKIMQGSENVCSTRNEANKVWPLFERDFLPLAKTC
jgi:hypothetical protein